MSAGSRRLAFWAMLLPKLLGNCLLLGESCKYSKTKQIHCGAQKMWKKWHNKGDKAKGKFPGGYLTNIFGIGEPLRV